MTDIAGTLPAPGWLQPDWSVPAFAEQRLRPRRTRYCLIIPVLNEGERIRNQLRKMAKLGLTDLIDTIIVDGGSKDGSLATDFLSSVGLTALLTKTGPGKLSAQLRVAYAWALHEGYEGIVTIDGNDKDGVDTLPSFVGALEEGYGYVQASRFLRGGAAVNTPLVRLLAIRLIHAPLLSLAARRWFTDTTQGYRAYSAAYLLDPRVKPFREVFDRYELLAYLTVRASQLGYRTKEIATLRIYPKGEPVPTKIAGLAALIDLLAVVWRTMMGRYHPGGGALQS